MSIDTRFTQLEESLLGEISRETLWQYVSTVAKDERMSGSAEERVAMDYVAETLRSFGITVDRYEHDGYVSKPGAASREIIAPDRFSIDCITHSFATSATLEGDVVPVGRGRSDEYEGKDVAGKIVLIEGLAAPEPVTTAERFGVAGAIFINDHNLHQMIVTPIWGTPTPETVHRLPKIPVISIRLDDGGKLNQLAETGSLRARIQTSVETYWATLPVIVGTFEGSGEPDKFVMLAGHIDSWFYGAVDNAAANATTLECMRILAAHRDQLRRGFRVVIWSGHSHGRYAGSTWYADTFWDELYDKCVAYVNVDSTGAIQATLYQELLAMPETAALAKNVVSDLTGQTAEVNRVGRAGDQSFWGIGIPSVFMSLSRVPAETAPELSRTMGSLTGRKKSGQAWFWHTEHDTLDKVDLDVLVLDTKIYLLSIMRLMNAEVLPFDYGATVGELLEALERYNAVFGGIVSLDPVIERAQRLARSLEVLESKTRSDLDPNQIDELNQTLIKLGRTLVPLNYTEKGPFEHDFALHAPALPALRPGLSLPKLDPAGDEFKFLRAQTARRKNLVSFTFRQAQEIVDDMLERLQEA